MALLLEEIDWGDPVVPRASSPAWEAELKARIGIVPDVLKRLAPVPWLCEADLNWGRYPVATLSERLAGIGALVTSQENTCRYCYGVARAYLRILGYSKRTIERWERETHLAELAPKEREVVTFCRILARFKPRPTEGERQALLNQGFTPQQVAELAFWVAANCFHNRVTTFIAAPPVSALENSLATLPRRLLRPLLARKLRKAFRHRVPEGRPADGLLPQVAAALEGLPARGLLQYTLDAAFASTVLSAELKWLMFAVVARSLDCSHCEGEARAGVEGTGWARDDVLAALDTLRSQHLDAREQAILAWTRATVHYEPRTIQELTRALYQDIGQEAVLEAIGVAALANACVRLAMLLPRAETFNAGRV